jgi:hypothetical protein
MLLDSLLSRSLDQMAQRILQEGQAHQDSLPRVPQDCHPDPGFMFCGIKSAAALCQHVDGILF